MKILKFIGLFVGTAALLALLIFGLNWYDFKTVFENEDGLREGTEFVEQTFSLAGLLDFMMAHPNQVSLYSEKGTNSDSVISFRSDEPRTMGSLSYLYLLDRYLTSDSLQNAFLNHPVTVADFEPFTFPYQYRSNHIESIRWLKDREMIQDGIVISVDSLFKAGIAFNDHIIHDALFYRLNMHQQGGNAPYLVPFFALDIAVHPDINQKPFKELLSFWKTLSVEQRTDSLLRIADEYLLNPDVRTSIQSTFQEKRNGITFLQEKESYSMYPSSTQIELTRIFKDLLTLESTSSRAYPILSWPMNDPTIRRHFTQYAGIFDTRIGLLNGVDWGVDRLTNHSFYQSVSFDQVPIALWLHLSSNYMNQDFQRRLMWDPELWIRTFQAVSANSKLSNDE